MLHYSLDTKVVENNEVEKTILLNRESGLWIKIPNEWKEVLDNFLNQTKELKQYLSVFEDKENAETFLKLVNKLLEYGMLTDSPNKERRSLHKVQFALTERCNLFCSHCCYNAKRDSSNNDLDLNSIKIIIDRIVACNPNPDKPEKLFLFSTPCVILKKKGVFICYSLINTLIKFMASLPVMTA